MIADPGQLRDDHANVLASRGQLDVQQLLDGAMPGHLIQGRADVVLAVGDRHILVVVEMLTQLLEARVQITDIGRGLEDSLAVELENQAQGRMRGRMLGPEVERPRRSPGLGFHFRSVEQVRRHHESLSRKGTFTSRAGLKPGPKRVIEQALQRLPTEGWQTAGGHLTIPPATAWGNYAARRVLATGNL